jgi:DNA (cytosine-5)-methyltransferase 1
VVGRRDGRAFEFPTPTHSGWSEHTRKFDTDLIPHVTARDAFRNINVSSAEDEYVDGQYGELAAEVPPGQNYLWHTTRYGGRDRFEWRSRYWTFLLRLDPDRPSSTLQAQPGPYVGPFHWDNIITESGDSRARRLRVPEILRLMSFPDDFMVPSKRADVQRQLGNAVPLELGKAVARALLTQLGYIRQEKLQPTFISLAS